MADAHVATLQVEGMSCASCVGRVERGLKDVAGLSDVSVNLAAETARFSFDAPQGVTRAVDRLRDLGYPARETSVTLAVEAMSCASCVGRVDKALAAVPGVVSVNVNLASETAQVTFVDGATDVTALQRAAQDAGYPATVTTGADAPDRAARKEEEARVLARRVLLAAVLALLLFGSSEWYAAPLGLWQAVGVQQEWMGIALYVLPAEVALGLGAWWAYQRTGGGGMIEATLVGAALSVFYTGALITSWFFIELGAWP